MKTPPECHEGLHAYIRYRCVCIHMQKTCMSVYMYVCIQGKHVHMIIDVFLWSRKPYQHHWNHNGKCQLIYRVMQQVLSLVRNAQLSTIPVLQPPPFEIQGLRIKLPSLRLEFAAELNHAARTPFLGHHNHSQ